MSIFTGSCAAIVTPFGVDGKVNFDVLGKLVEFQISNGTDALAVCGTTGEASTLTDDEQIETIRFVVAKSAKRVPIIAGAGSNDTEHGINLCKRAQDAGADALLLVTPYYNKTTQKGLVEHYAAHAKKLSIPFIVYNIPGRTGLNILPKTFKELIKIDAVQGVKEASGNIMQIAEIVELCGDRLDIYAGNDDYIVPVLSLGGKGVISTAANIVPKQLHDMVAKYLAGDTAGSLAIQIGMLELIRGLFCEVNPIPVKAALNKMGMEVGGYRAPLTTMEPQNEAQLEKALKNYGLI
ncbi:MAG: 4-hydroxy-tetrahydrodipicolinate synthase [Clostridiales bacterium]|jgi:4-hydroxy-tetrahydrodipicolinate synthase|nr:4-hydroxy-tetrahydrodipicolinate synthase [Clostridiales bacterium]